MNTDDQLIDRDQIWIPLIKLQNMLLASGQATLVTLKKNTVVIPTANQNWIFKSNAFLLKDIMTL